MTHRSEPIALRRTATWIAILSLFLASPRQRSEAKAAERLPFPYASVLRHVRYLAETIGPRPGGSAQVDRAAEYVYGQMRALGAKVTYHRYRLPNGRWARNVIADVPGRSGKVYAFGAHLDTVSGSPGANDDGSGVGVMIELARALQSRQLKDGYRFLFFSAEEALPGRHDHGWSSLAYMKSLSPAERRKFRGMIMLDKLGAGPDFKMLHIRGSEPAMAERLAAVARETGSAAQRKTVRRWSDEMAFEDANIPTCWVEWGPDPNLHTDHDVAAAMKEAKVMAVVRLVWAAVGPQ